MNLYQQAYLVGIFFGYILFYFIDNIIQSMTKNKFKEFLGENKLLDKYYQWKRYR